MATLTFPESSSFHVNVDKASDPTLLQRFLTIVHGSIALVYDEKAKVEAASQLASVKPTWDAAVKSGDLFVPFDQFNNPFGTAVIMHMGYPVTGQDAGLGWEDPKVPTLRILQRNGAVDLMKEGILAPIDWHNHPHSSATSSKLRPHPRFNKWPGDSAETVEKLYEAAITLELERLKRRKYAIGMFMGQWDPERMPDVCKRLGIKLQPLAINVDTPSNFSGIEDFPEQLRLPYQLGTYRSKTTGEEHYFILDAFCHPSAFMYARAVADYTDQAAGLQATRMDFLFDTIYTVAQELGKMPINKLRVPFSFIRISVPIAYQSGVYIASGTSEVTRLSAQWHVLDLDGRVSQLEYAEMYAQDFTLEYIKKYAALAEDYPANILPSSWKPDSKYTMDLAEWAFQAYRAEQLKQPNYLLELESAGGNQQLCIDTDEGDLVVGPFMNRFIPIDNEEQPVSLMTGGNTTLVLENEEGAVWMDHPNVRTLLARNKRDAPDGFTMRYLPPTGYTNLTLENDEGTTLGHNRAYTMNSANIDRFVSSLPEEAICRWVKPDTTLCLHQAGSTATLRKHVDDTHAIWQPSMKSGEWKCGWEGCEYSSEAVHHKQQIYDHLNKSHIRDPSMYQCKNCVGVSFTSPEWREHKCIE